MDLIRCNQHEGSQAGLVQAREDDAGDNEHEHDFAQDPVGHLQKRFDTIVQACKGSGQPNPPLEAFHHDGDEFNIENMQVYHDAHGHFEQD